MKRLMFGLALFLLAFFLTVYVMSWVSFLVSLLGSIEP